jgi:hypothetical protein
MDRGDVHTAQAGKKGTEFVVIRGNDGSWKRFGR